MWQDGPDKARGRFYSEYGVIGPCNVASIREYLRPDELYIESSSWKIHQNLNDHGSMAKGIGYHYGDPRGLSLSEYVLYGQMFQALIHGGVVEAMRFRKHDRTADCQGVLAWSYNDLWGEVGFSIIDRYLRRKASYYWFRRACFPVKVLVRSRDGRLVTRVVNDTLKRYRAKVCCGWMRLDGAGRELREYPVTIPMNDLIEVASVPFPSAAERNPREWVYAAILTCEGLPDDQAMWWLAPRRELALAQPIISAKVQGRTLEVSSQVYCHGVHLEDNGREVLADNYFELLPGIPLRVAITAPILSGVYPLAAVMPIATSRGAA
jgi:beta-mannosidase